MVLLNTRQDMNRRLEKINKLLSQELAKAIHSEFAERFGIITVNLVNTSPDLKNAKVYLSIIGSQQIEPELIIRSINQQSHNFRRLLIKKLSLKFIPEFEFAIDKSLNKVNQIETIIDQINNENDT